MRTSRVGPNCRASAPLAIFSLINSLGITAALTLRHASTCHLRFPAKSDFARLVCAQDDSERGDGWRCLGLHQSGAWLLRYFGESAEHWAYRPRTFDVRRRNGRVTQALSP